jgi:hypothetical protein
LSRSVKASRSIPFSENGGSVTAYPGRAVRKTPVCGRVACMCRSG